MVEFAPEFADTEPYDEFALVAENAAEMGVAWPAEHMPRRVAFTLGTGQKLSVIRWGEADPELVFLHGGGQNAHTWDSVIVALAGPATNLLLAAVSVVVLAALPETVEARSLTSVLAQMALASVWINCVLAVFNLIPVPPLDGGRLLTALLPLSVSRAVRAMEGVGFIVVLLVVMNTNLVGWLVRPVVGFYLRLAGLVP